MKQIDNDRYASVRLVSHVAMSVVFTSASLGLAAVGVQALAAKYMKSGEFFRKPYRWFAAPAGIAGAALGFIKASNEVADRTVSESLGARSTADSTLANSR